MSEFKAIHDQIITNPRYQANILYGKPRSGHAEGTVKAHIADLESNLAKLVEQGLVEAGSERYWQLKVLIHVHDSFKMEAKRDSAILHPQSHASLAKAFLAEYTSDRNMLNITQFHDIGYAVFKKMREGKGHLWEPNSLCQRCKVRQGTPEADAECIDEQKLNHALFSISDLDLFLLFAIIDACTPSKGRQMIHWLVSEVAKRFPNITAVRPEHILPGPERVGEAW